MAPKDAAAKGTELADGSTGSDAQGSYSVGRWLHQDKKEDPWNSLGHNAKNGEKQTRTKSKKRKDGVGS
ncbi:hypothetical protein DL764_006923 [Monosporascus ibericus]|uniref:Uncharacterized protein n=1 Tax=Monosporascus ibericus TaxID=155417 RepID=A0A4Q4T718_9PEZI|nr:hypothetical protein DL764_006923 [Monosporascus ibericus]